MKFDKETLQQAVRKRRQEAGEAIQPTRKVRRKVQREPTLATEESGSTPAPEAPAERIPTEGVESAAGPSGVASAEKPAEDSAPQGAAPAEEEPSDEAPAHGPVEEEVPVEAAPTEEAGEQVVTASDLPVSADPAVERAAEDGERATSEPSARAEEQAAEESAAQAREPAVRAEEAITPPAREGVESGPARDETKETGPGAPTKRRSSRRAVKKTSAGPWGPPRSAPKFPGNGGCSQG